MILKKQLLTFWFVIGSVTLLSAQQQPEWINSDVRAKKYPTAFYLQGFSSMKINKQDNEDEIKKRLENYAKHDLIESVQVTMNGLSELKTVEENDEVKQYYRETIASTSSLNISGLNSESWVDQKSKMVYAFVYARKSDVLNQYKAVISEKLKLIEQNISLAENAFQINDNQQAIKKYRESYPLFRELEQAQSIFIAVNNSMLNDASLYIDKSVLLKRKIAEGIRKIEKSSSLNLEDAAAVLALSLLDQTGKMTETIRLSNFTYQDTRMSSEFALRFTKSFQSKLIQNAGYSIVTEATNNSEQMIIQGTYWEENEGLRIIALLKNINTGKVLASTEAEIPQVWFTNNSISVKPENFGDAYSRMKEFKKDELSGGDLNIEFWTNKGNDNLIFSQGEIMKIFVRVNKECYLRAIYHMADGTQVLLLDNYYVGSDKINTVYELPYEFECSEPFGAEILQVNGQTEVFSHLNTYNQDGYDFIENSLSEVLVNTRGMKKVNKVMKAEKRLIITTLSN